MTLQDIIARLEAGETGRELDAMIHCAVNGLQFRKGIYAPVRHSPTRRRLVAYRTDKGDRSVASVPHYQASLNTCLELHEQLLPGWHYELHSYDNSAKVWFDRPDTMPHRAKSLPAAWLIAILKAWEWEAQQ